MASEDSAAAQSRAGPRGRGCLLARISTDAVLPESLPWAESPAEGLPVWLPREPCGGCGPRAGGAGGGGLAHRVPAFVPTAFVPTACARAAPCPGAHLCSQPSGLDPVGALRRAPPRSPYVASLRTLLACEPGPASVGRPVIPGRDAELPPDSVPWAVGFLCCCGLVSHPRGRRLWCRARGHPSSCCRWHPTSASSRTRRGLGVQLCGLLDLCVTWLRSSSMSV